MISSKCLALFVACLKYTTSAVLNELQDDIISHYDFESDKEVCMLKIINKYFPHGSHFQLHHSMNDLINIHSNINTGICCNHTYTSRTKERIWTTNGYIISVRNKTEFIGTMNLLKTDKGWNPRAKYIIEVEKFEENVEFDLFEILLDSNIFDVIILKRHSSEIEILTYFCVDNNNCCKTVNNITSLGKCRDLDKADLFPNKIKNNFRNCTVTVAVSEDPPLVIDKNNKDFQFLDNVDGVEQYMLSNIGHEENISMEYILVPPSSRYGMVLPNGTFTGSLYYVQNKTASIVAGAFVLLKNRADSMDPMFGYYFPRLKVYTSAVSDQSWKRIYQPFGGATFWLIALTYITFTIVIIIVRRLLIGYEDRQWIMLRTWGYLYGNIDSKLFRSKKLRIFLTIWILFAYFISSFYNTALFSILTRKNRNISPAYDKRFTTFMTPCISETVLTLFEYTFNETLITDPSPECVYIETALDIVGKERNLYTIYMEYSYQFREHKYIDKEGNRKMDTWDYASNFVMTIYTTKGFPLLEMFQRYINYFFETGLASKHLDDIYYKSQLLKSKRSNHFKPVPLSDFRVHFSILVFGMLISIVCFVIELNR